MRDIDTIYELLKKKLAGGLSVVLPVYNEEKNIEGVANSILAYLPKISDDFEIIIVNDGSTDRSREIIDLVAARHKEIIPINHERNRGYGATLATGFRNSKKRFIFFMDSDDQFRISDLSKLVYFIDDYDIVAGIRNERRDPLIRDINGTVFNFVMKFLFKVPIIDIDCAFKLFRREVVDEMTFCTTGALINTEIFVKAKLRGKKITFVGIEHYPRTRGRQTGAAPKVVIRALWEVVLLLKDVQKMRAR